jgi:hypothetical protein
MTDAIDFRKLVQGTDAAAIEKSFEAGAYDNLSKNDWLEFVNKRASQIRKADESFESAFTNAITSDDLGRTLFRCHQQCNGRRFYKQIFDTPPGPVAKAVDPTPHIGPAHREMDALATDRQRASGRSYEMSYAAVYSDNNNAALRERVKSEFLRRAMRMGAGGSDVDGGTELGGPGSMTLTEAMAMARAKPFPPGYSRGN